MFNQIKHKMNTSSVILLVAAVALGVASMLLVSANELLRLKNLNELYEAAKKLESAELQVSNWPEEARIAEKRFETLYAFSRESKSFHCKRHYARLQDLTQQYQSKAINYIADSKKPDGMFNAFMKMFSPINAMKSLSKSDSYLATITERYESQAKSGILSEADVDCDMTKFNIKTLNEMLFVIQTDVKYLIIEDSKALNYGIYLQIIEDKFTASHNFYNIYALEPRQQKLLFDYYVAHVDTNKVTVGEALEHYYKPGNLITGRLIESCHALLKYKKIWSEMEPVRQKVCEQSKSDPQNESFASEYKLSAYDETATLCSKLIDTL